MRSSLISWALLVFLCDDVDSSDCSGVKATTNQSIPKAGQLLPHSRALYYDGEPLKLKYSVAARNSSGITEGETKRPSSRRLARLQRRSTSGGTQRRHAPLGCEQFAWPDELTSIAIVGNGPLSRQHRDEIEVSTYRLEFG